MEGKSISATISDVAELAGVSTATVSRVLSGAASVRPDTQQRVEDAMARLNYRPSAVARSLRMQSTAVIGLIVTDITNPFYPDLVRGMEDEILQQGRSVLLGNGAGSADREQRYLDVLLERRVDAVVVASSGLAERYAARLDEFPVPVVLVNTDLPGRPLPAVIADSRSGGRLAAEHLLSRGYTRIVYISGGSESKDTSQRQAGVVDVVGDALTTVDGGGHLDGGARAMHHLAESVEPPFGIVAHNDLTAIGALAALHELGWDVPAQVGVVGFDDIAMSRFVTPSLTTIFQDKYGMGVVAAQTVDRLLAGEKVEGTTVLPVELIARASTDRPET
jgi:LacI family transcriptional regulator